MDESERPAWDAGDEAEYIVVREALREVRERQADVRRRQANARLRTGVRKPAPLVPWEWYDPADDSPSVPDDLSSLG